MELGRKEDIEKAAKEATEKATIETEQKTKIETAKKMLEEKLDINLISKITGLSKEEINSLN